MELQAISWRQSQAVSEQYIQSFDQVHALYEYDYRDQDTYRTRAKHVETQAGERAPSEAVVEALLHYNQKIGNDSAALQAIRKLMEPDTLVVVGGQQAGLFTGPLMVIYKAVTIIRQAREASELLGRPVLPVFWIAGEDHDLAEVNHIYQLSSQLTIDRLELEVPAEEVARRLTISRRKITDEQWEQVVSQLEASLQTTAYTVELLRELREVLLQADQLTDAFARVMAKLFGSYGLILMDADDALLRRAEGAFFETLIMQNEKLEQALYAGRAAMIAHGYEPLADIRENAANLFWIESGERILLMRDADGGFVDRSGQLRFTSEQLIEHARRQPERFSNNVLTRPLMQEFLLPVLATVLGPGEIAYWGLTREAFRAFGMRMPIVVPRLEFTLVEKTVYKQLNKLGLSVQDAIFHLEEKREAWLRAHGGVEIEEHFAKVKEQFDAWYTPTLQWVGSLHPGLKPISETNRRKMMEQIDFLEKRAIQALAEQHAADHRRFERIKQSLTPLGKKQERVYNVFAYLNKYGSDWIKQLIEVQLDSGKLHWVIYI